MFANIPNVFLSAAKKKGKQRAFPKIDFNQAD